MQSSKRTSSSFEASNKQMEQEVEEEGKRPKEQLSIFGALAAQRALRKFLAPHKGLFSKVTLRRFSRTSQTPLESMRFSLTPAPPTYQLMPREPLRPHRLIPFIEEAIQSGVERAANSHQSNFDPGGLAKALANEVRTIVKGIGPPRFKYVVHVIATKEAGQCLYAASRALLAQGVDKHFSVHFAGGGESDAAGKRIIVNVTVFGIYFD